MPAAAQIYHAPEDLAIRRPHRLRRRSPESWALTASVIGRIIPTTRVTIANARTLDHERAWDVPARGGKEGVLLPEFNDRPRA